MGVGGRRVDWDYDELSGLKTGMTDPTVPVKSDYARWKERRQGRR